MGELPVCRLNDLDSECLSMDRMCDGVQDCVDGTDESLEACGMRAGVCSYIGGGGRVVTRCGMYE